MKKSLKRKKFRETALPLLYKWLIFILFGVIAYGVGLWFGHSRSVEVVSLQAVFIGPII